MSAIKTKITIILLFSLIAIGNAQSKDSIALAANPEKLTYKKFIAPAVLITTGTLMLNSEINQNIQKDFRNLFGEDFHTTADNYLQYVPIAQIYGGRYLGFKPKHDFLHQSINIFVANAMMGVVVETLKHTVKEERPDQSDNLSFPSGHTATAFTNASLLFYEYKDSSFWYASSGYLFATATGILRIANDKHYTSDVLAGAGIGLAAGTIVSYWNPFKSFHLGKNKKTTSLLYPQLGKQIGLGLLIQTR